MPYFYISVSTNSPQDVMDGIMNVLRRIQAGGYDDEWLMHLKNTYITRSYINEQSTSEIAFNLGQAEILGNWQYADDLPQLVNMVTVEQMNRVINTYVAGLKWYYLGNQEMAQSLKIPQ
jgi:predicted Zn-dependent peptidase